jgi:hypothetical protein
VGLWLGGDCTAGWVTGFKSEVTHGGGGSVSGATGLCDSCECEPLLVINLLFIN